MIWEVLILVVFAYLMGSIPFAAVFTFIFTGGKKKLSEEGTGSIGTENAWFVGGWPAGLLTGIFDFSKGVFAMILAYYLFGWSFSDNLFAMLLLSIPTWIGHCFSVWLKFYGGVGGSIYYGVRLYIASPFLFGLGMLFFVPNIFFKNKYKKVAFNHVMSLGVNVIFAGIFFTLEFIDIGLFGWGLPKLLGQEITSWMPFVYINLIWIFLNMFVRCLRRGFISDVKSGISVWKSIWIRSIFEAAPHNTTYQFPDEKMKLTDVLIWGKEVGK